MFEENRGESLRASYKLKSPRYGSHRSLRRRPRLFRFRVRVLLLCWDRYWLKVRPLGLLAARRLVGPLAYCRKLVVWWWARWRRRLSRRVNMGLLRLG